jgi:hypothetical protein
LNTAKSVQYSSKALQLDSSHRMVTEVYMYKVDHRYIGEQRGQRNKAKVKTLSVTANKQEEEATSSHLKITVKNMI